MFQRCFKKNPSRMSTMLEYRTITFLVWNHQSNVAITHGSCTTLWAVPDVLFSECKSTFLEAWGVGSTTLLTRGVALQGIKLCLFSWKRYCRSRTHPDWCLVFALCERHWTWKEHVDFLWVCLANHCDPHSSAHLEKMRNTRRHLLSTNCWLSQSWVFRPLLLQRYMYYVL